MLLLTSLVDCADSGVPGRVELICAQLKTVTSSAQSSTTANDGLTKRVAALEKELKAAQGTVKEKETELDASEKQSAQLRTNVQTLTLKNKAQHEKILKMNELVVRANKHIEGKHC